MKLKPSSYHVLVNHSTSVYLALTCKVLYLDNLEDHSPCVLNKLLLYSNLAYEKSFSAVYIIKIKYLKGTKLQKIFFGIKRPHNSHSISCLLFRYTLEYLEVTLDVQ